MKSVKDHKDNFSNFSTIILINRPKSEIGKISKSILDKINNALVEECKRQQMKTKTENNLFQSSFLQEDKDQYW